MEQPEPRATEQPSRWDCHLHRLQIDSGARRSLAASRDKRFSARETLRCRMPDPSASIAGDTAVSPWLVVMWEALSSAAAGCRAEGTWGVSLNHSELSGSKCIAPPEADPTGAGDGPARTASTARRAVTRRIARRACFCVVSVFRASRCCLLPIGDLLGILNSRRNPL